jgi:putative glutamine amidotransferase
MSKPLIGITPSYDYNDCKLRISDGYFRGIEAAGGIPIILPVPAFESTLESIVSKLDGILLSGGTDIDPMHYSESTLPQNGDINPFRDETELFLAKYAYANRIPMLGICRGIQMMNVAMGGSLYQDLQSQYEDKLVKHSQIAPSWYPCHSIYIEKESNLYKILGVDKIEVNSFHHQAIKLIASDLRVTAKAPDGVIEAIECDKHSFFIGVQWHPELMWEKNPQMMMLFEAFVKAM